MRTFTLFASLVAIVSAEDFLVTVGSNNGLTYDPPSVTAKRGDTVAFRFLSKNHTVTQSSFANPCEPLASGVDSGYLPVAADATEFPQWSFSIEDDTAPLWFYCAQGRHCQAGMVFALNPTPERTYEAFRATAMGATPPAEGSGSIGSGASATPTPSETLSGALTTVSGTDTASNPTATSAGNSSDPNGAMAMSAVGRSALSGLMVLLGVSMFLI